MSYRAHSPSMEALLNSSPEHSLKRKWSDNPTLGACPSTASDAAQHDSLATAVQPRPLSNPLMRIYGSDLEGEDPQLLAEPKYDARVGIDFGTTFTAAAFSIGDKIFPVESWPEDPSPLQPGKQVPSVLWYPNRAKGLMSRNMPETPDESGPRNLDKIDSSIFREPDTSSLKDRPIAYQTYKHGYEAERLHQLPKAHRKGYSTTGYVSGLKLLLDESPHTQSLRDELNDTLEDLKKRKLIRKDEDVIRDFFIPLLRIIRKEMEGHGLTSQSKVEVIITVPVCWTPGACSKMARAVSEAISQTEFFVARGESVRDLFMVNEAEAAATYVLNAGLHGLKRGENFILVDCGGGTVDSGIYRIAQEHPLRLAEEVFSPEGVLAGGNLLNKELKEFSKNELLKERSLFRNVSGLPSGYVSPDSIAKTYILADFEREVKRTVDFADPLKPYCFRIPGLRASKKNRRILDHYFVLDQNDMLGIFKVCLSPIGKLVEMLVERWVEDPWHQGNEIDKVVVVGGFSDSPALRLYLSKRLEKIKDKYGIRRLQLILTQRGTLCATGVAHGAILRAMDKSRGPKKVARLSVGLLRHFPYERETINEHPELAPLHQGKCSEDKFNGQWYINNTVVWIIKAGQGPLASKHTATFISEFAWFNLKDKWLAKEVLYQSETCTEDYYQTYDKKNKGKITKIGQLELDLNFLKGKISPSTNALPSKKKLHYVARVLIKAVLIDRDIKFVALWPAREDGQPINDSQQSVNIVATFQPGTK